MPLNHQLTHHLFVMQKKGVLKVSRSRGALEKFEMKTVLRLCFVGLQAFFSSPMR